MSPPAHRVHDKDVLDALEAIGGHPFEGTAWRITRDGRPALRGSTADGRWSPPGEFEVLYISLERDGALAEIGHRLALEPVWPGKIVHTLHQVHLSLARAVRLDDLKILEALGVDSAKYRGYGYAETNKIAAAAQFLGFDGLIVPNARFACLNAVVLLENRDPAADFAILGSEPVDWAAWRKKQL